jgi:ABC-2 type transport system permease protein
MKPTLNSQLPFFVKSVWEYRKKSLWYGVIMAAYGMMMIGFFPTIRDQSAKFSELLDAYPPALRVAFGIGSQSLSTVEGFLSVEYFSLIWVIIIAIYIFSIGVNTLAGEIDKGTSDFSFTLPMRRVEIVFTKFMANLYLVSLVILATLAATAVGMYTVGETPSAQGFLAFFFIGLLMSFFLLALTTFFSAVFGSKGRVYAAVGAVFVISYAAHIIAGISGKFSNVYYVSFFKYYGDPAITLTTGNFEWTSWLVFAVAGLVLLGGSLVISERRDL